MGEQHLSPGSWPELSKAAYGRLVRLAARRLVGCEAGAEDAVTNAMIKWLRIDPGTSDVARIEQVVKSEADSWRRSEERRHAREHRYGADRSQARTARLDPQAELDLLLLVRALVETADRKGIAVCPQDLAVLRYLVEGESMSEVCRMTKQSRYAILSSRQKWQLVWKLAITTDRENPLFGQIGGIDKSSIPSRD